MLKRKIAAAISAGALLAASFLPALAATTADVAATVTPQNISVTVSPTSVAYGTLAVSASDASRTTALSGVITATNDGNVTETFNIRGSNATGGSTPWTLSSTPAATGTVGSNQFAHRFDEGAVFTGVEAAALDSSASKPLKTGVLTSGTADFVLQMNMPTSVTDIGVQKSTTVTVLATAP